AIAPERHHESIGLDDAAPAFGVDDDRTGDRIAFDAQRFNPVLESELHTPLPAKFRETAGKLMRIAGFIIRRKRSADEFDPRRAQRRLELHAFRSALDVHFAAVTAQ